MLDEAGDVDAAFSVTVNDENVDTEDEGLLEASNKYASPIVIRGDDENNIRVDI